MTSSHDVLPVHSSETGRTMPRAAGIKDPESEAEWLPPLGLGSER